MLSIQCPQFPQWISICLFTDVSNPAEIRQQLLTGTLEYAFIDAVNVSTLEHLMAAVYRALLDYNSSNMRTRNIHSEIVFSMSPNNNIMDSLKRFGISDDTVNLYAIKIADTQQSAENAILQLANLIKGTMHHEDTIDDSVIGPLCDLTKVMKLYKTVDTPGIVGAISLRGH